MLKISDIRLWISLGCSEEEKKLQKCISIDVEIKFNGILTAVVSDDINDTVSYVTIVDEIRKLCVEKGFNLIEHVAGEIHKVVRETVHIPVEKITVKVTKILPPVADIHGGVSFIYSI